MNILNSQTVASSKPVAAHMFWAYGNFSNLEIICASSFIAKGYSLSLWTYGDISNAPAGTSIRDAREIIPEKDIFLNRVGSHAAFSDIFRYAVLNTHGGLWADTDVIALQPASSLPKRNFLVTERTREKIGLRHKLKNFFSALPRGVGINGNVIHNYHPAKGNLIDRALSQSLLYPRDKIEWAEIGPKLLTKLAKTSVHDFKIFPPSFANPIDFWDCPNAFLQTSFQTPNDCFFIHCFNSMWWRAGIDTNMSFPKGSLLATLADNYL